MALRSTRIYFAIAIASLGAMSCSSRGVSATPSGAQKAALDEARFSIPNPFQGLHNPFKKSSGEDLTKAKEELARFSSYAKEREDFERRADEVRQSILKGADLSPLPTKTDLNPIIHGRIEGNGYTVENVAFESFPGFFVTGNLYKPSGRAGQVPGILVPHGHFRSRGYNGARTRPENQALCAQLARMGAVVFTWDMVGWGDAMQIEHEAKDALRLQLWNSVRAVDFLETLPEVDPARIGVTGASSGGTQAILLAAIDPRIAVSAPVVKVTVTYEAGCTCEKGMPIRDLANTKNVEIAALTAPKPQLFVSAGNDVTSHFPEMDFKYMQQVYGLYGATEQVENVHLKDEAHDFGPNKRKAVYDFFIRKLGLTAVPLDGTIKASRPENFPLQPQYKLNVWTRTYPQPHKQMNLHP